MVRLNIGVLATLTLALAACVPVTPLHPAATDVKVTEVVPAKGCTLVKALSVDSGNGGYAVYRSHQEIQQDQLNQLKNMTAQAGGNVFQLEKHQTTYERAALSSSTGTLTTPRESEVISAHVMAGNAYQCNAQALATIAANQPSTKVNDVKSK